MTTSGAWCGGGCRSISIDLGARICSSITALSSTTDRPPAVSIERSRWQRNAADQAIDRINHHETSCSHDKASATDRLAIQHRDDRRSRGRFGCPRQTDDYTDLQPEQAREVVLRAQLEAQQLLVAHRIQKRVAELAGKSARARDQAEPIAAKKTVKLVDPLPRKERLAMYKQILEKQITDFDPENGGIEAHFDRRLAAELKELDRACHLTAAQTKKLQLAGRAETQWKMFKRKIAAGAPSGAFLRQEGYEFGDGHPAVTLPAAESGADRAKSGS